MKYTYKLNIIDLYNDYYDSLGTQVELDLPLN